MDALREEAERLLTNGALGRSSQLGDLFNFLAQRSSEGRSPKEAEIADLVFGRSTGFNPGEDALVRVHVHRLRSKLDQHYAANPNPDGTRLTIPKGEYRLVLESAPAVAEAIEPVAPANLWRSAAIILAAAVAGLAIALLFRPARETWEIQRKPLWATILNDNRTTLVIVGDRFLFGERTGGGRGMRLILDDSIGSAEELDERRMLEPKVAGQYFNPDVYQLPIGIAAALRQVMPVVAGTDLRHQRVRLLPMSQVTADMLRVTNVVYIGHLSGLGLLEEPTFAGSGLRPELNFRQLVDQATGRSIASVASEDTDPNLKSADFGYISSFIGPTNNRVIVIAGGRDAGLMQASELVANTAFLDRLARETSNARDFEAVVTTTSLHHMNMGSWRLETARPLKTAAIWDSIAPR